MQSSMRLRVGCFGLVLGSLVGLLLLMLTLLLLARQAVSPLIPQTTHPAPDASLFLSEQSLSRLASKNTGHPTRLDFQPDGQLKVTTQVEVAGFEPVVRLGLSLEMQDGRAVSQLHWAKIGFIKLSADWLPADIVNMGTIPGQIITGQIPPEFILVGLETGPEGIGFQLNGVR